MIFGASARMTMMISMMIGAYVGADEKTAARLPIIGIMVGMTIKSRCRPAPLAFAENGGRVGTR